MVLTEDKLQLVFLRLVLLLCSKNTPSSDGGSAPQTEPCSPDAEPPLPLDASYGEAPLKVAAPFW